MKVIAATLIVTLLATLLTAVVLLPTMVAFIRWRYPPEPADDLSSFTYSIEITVLGFVFFILTLVTGLIGGFITYKHLRARSE